MRALVILNGDYVGDAILQSLALESDFIICADGGARHAEAAKIRVDMLLGDMDSYAGDLSSCIEKEEYPVDKDLTDGELAIETAIKRGAHEIVITCAHGGRPDHAFGNYLLLQKAYRNDIDCKMVTDQFEISMINGRYSANTVPGKTVSVLPFGEDYTYLKNTGLKYEVNEPVRVKSYDCFGISNITRFDFFEIFTDGEALIFKEL